MASFTIERVASGRLRAGGELGFATAAEALEAGAAHLARADDEVIDLGGVTAGDSAGVAVLVEWIATATARGVSLRYENVPQQMLAIARISDLQDLLIRN